MKLITAFLGLGFAAIPSVLGQASEWGQCGGIGWTGATTCQAGLVCTHLNDWYFQCLKGSSTSSPPPPSSSSKPPSSTSKPPSSTSSPSSSAPSSSGTPGVKTWFSFGDSYTATGFSATGTQPSTKNPFGNPTYPGNTACGTVPNWVDYLATQYNTSITEVFNHAYSGGTIDQTLVAPYSSSILSVSDQVKLFLNYEASGKQYYNGWTASSTLFSVWIGINDIGSTYTNSGDRAAFNGQLIDRYFQLVQSLYTAGARNFLFMSVPPVYRTPLMLSSSTTAQNQEKTVIDDYNAKLTAKAQAFLAANAGVSVTVYDTTPLFNTILNSPSTYGLRDATSYGDGNTYTWCNVYHPSPPVHLQIAKAVAPLVVGKYI